MATLLEDRKQHHLLEMLYHRVFKWSINQLNASKIIFILYNLQLLSLLKGLLSSKYNRKNFARGEHLYSTLLFMWLIFNHFIVSNYYSFYKNNLAALEMWKNNFKLEIINIIVLFLIYYHLNILWSEVKIYLLKYIF